MSSELANWIGQISSDGYALIENAIESEAVDQACRELSQCVASPTGSATIRTRGNRAYAARNLLDVLPISRTIWRTPSLIEILRQTLGDSFGLVRGLFFDKHPDESWSLPWHKDMTIAVRANSQTSRYFSKPTTKAGVPHVEAAQKILDKMLTIRIHLDPAVESNGPLRVIPGSHLSKQAAASDAGQKTIFAAPGDALAMRPLLTHASCSSSPDTTRHRRIIHLEFASSPELPDDYQWYWFVPFDAQKKG